MAKLHEYILNGIAQEESFMETIKQEKSWLREDGKVLNWQYGKMPEKEEKEAIEYFVNLNLKAIQRGLREVGEPLLTPEESKRFYKAQMERRLFEDDIERAKRFYVERQNRVRNHPYPHLYEQALVEDKMMDLLGSWTTSNIQEVVQKRKITAKVNSGR